MNNGTTTEVTPVQAGRTYDIQTILGTSKYALKKKIWRMSNSQEAIDAIALLNSRRGSFFSLAELYSLVDWLVWDDAAASGEADATTGLSEYRDRQCRKKHERALRWLGEIKAQEERKS